MVRTPFVCTMENLGGIVEDAKKQQSPKSGDLPEGLVLISSGSEGGSQDEEHEDGEIQDDDGKDEELGPRSQLDLEDISSEEESNIRERMAALEAMGEEFGLMKTISSHSTYDYLDGGDAVYGKENYFYYHSKKQQYRSDKEQKITSGEHKQKQNNRRDTFKRERMVATKRHFEKIKERSKRSTHRRHKRRRHVASSPSPQRYPISSDSEPEATVVREYLKIACATEHGRKGRILQASKNPLKKKLFHLASKKQEQKGNMVAVPDEEHVVEMIVDSASSPVENDGEQEESHLRLLALSTKPVVKKAGLNELISEFQVPSPPPPPSMVDPLNEDIPPELVPFESDSYPSEERELRLIALKSAVLRKHETRLKRREQDAERPYSPSDDIVLSPVREVPPAYDELDHDLYSDGRTSVEIIDEDDDVLIIENPCELIALDDTDEEGGNDMEISPVESPALPTERPDGCGTNDMTEDSQQPVDMELASSDPSSEPFPESMQHNMRPTSMLMSGADSCDSELFTRREKKTMQSPPLTPDSMEEAEAEALRHLLLTKMRKKKSRKETQEHLPEESTVKSTEHVMEPNEHDIEVVETEIETVKPLAEESGTSKPTEPVSATIQHWSEENATPCRSSSQVASQTVKPNLITLVNRTAVRKRRKKSQSVKGSMDLEIGTSTSKILASAVFPSTTRPDPLKSSLVRTQKLVNNPNKLINLNQTISPPSPVLPPSAAIPRTESPKDLTNVDTFVSRPVAKLVIQVGNSDSDSDVDFDSASPGEREVVPAGRISTMVTTSAPGVIFEEQLDRFLKSVRSKSNVAPDNDNTKECEHSGHNSTSKTSNSVRDQHQAKGSVKRTPSVPISGNTMVTSAAVKHLPKSAQIEYMHLMARMAQLEQHKLARQRFTAQKTILTATHSEPIMKESASHGGSNGALKTASECTPESHCQETVDTSSKLPGMESMFTKSPGKRKASICETQPPKGPVAGPNILIQNPMERKLQQIRSSIPNLSESSRNRLLLTAEKQLVKHSGTFLQELEQHNVMIFEAQQERRELYQFDSRIEMLKEKLALLERAREQQRHHSRNTFSSLQASHRKILNSRKRASELERMCHEIGQTIVGEEYQLPSSSNTPVLQEQLRTLVTGTRQLKAIRKPTLQEFKEQMLVDHRRKLIEASSSTPQKESWKETYPKGTRDKAEDKSTIVAQSTKRSVSIEKTTVQPEFDHRNENPSVENPEIQEKLGEIRLESDDGEEQTEQIEPRVVSDVQFAVNGIPESSLLKKAEQNEEAIIRDNQEKTIVIEKRMIEDGLPVDEPAPEEPIPFGKYTSPLLSLKQGVQHIPTGILCPYELGGQCDDRECKYEHFRPQ